MIVPRPSFLDPEGTQTCLPPPHPEGCGLSIIESDRSFVWGDATPPSGGLGIRLGLYQARLGKFCPPGGLFRLLLGLAGSNLMGSGLKVQGLESRVELIRV